MKYLSKKIAWLLAFVMIFTCIGFKSNPIYAAEDGFIIGEDTDIIVPAGSQVKTENHMAVLISYYESEDSDTPVYDAFTSDGNWGGLTIGNSSMAIKPHAWHITFEGIEDNSVYRTGGNYLYHFNAYPITSLEELSIGSTMTLPGGTTLYTTGPAINVAINVGTTQLKQELSNGPHYKLPSLSELSSLISETELETALPDLTNSFYTVELKDKDTNEYDLEITLVPAVSVTIDLGLGNMDMSDKVMYATPGGTIDTGKLPKPFLEGEDSTYFLGWRDTNNRQYIYLEKAPLYLKQNLSYYITKETTLKAEYREEDPAFKLDLDNKKITKLLPGREYNIYSKKMTKLFADDQGEISYAEIADFPIEAQFSLLPRDASKSEQSYHVSLHHPTPNRPIADYRATTARVIDTSDFDGCIFAIKQNGSSATLDWGDSSEFTGLTPNTSYLIYVKHSADENGFETSMPSSYYFTTLRIKNVSDEMPNGVTIEAIPIQAHTNSPVEPSLTIKDSSKNLIEGRDYTVDYENNVDVGSANVTITFIDSYSGTMAKSFTIDHKWQTAWDETHHWEECGGGDEQKNKALHIPGPAATETEPQVCTECGYILTPAIGRAAVSFNSNGGSGTMPDVSLTKGARYILPECGFTAPQGKTFKAWEISGIAYAPGTELTITQDTTAKALWQEKEVIKVPVKTPVISPDGGSFSSSQTITIATETEEAVIYYTTDGSEPTAYSTVYAGPFTINASAVIKAVAVKEGMLNSAVASASFTKSTSGGGGGGSSNSGGGSSNNGGNTSGGAESKDPAQPIPSAPSYPADSIQKELVLTIGKKEAHLDGKEIVNDVAPILRNSRTLLPARFIAESLGAQVNWDAKKQEVTIKGKNEKGEEIIILIYIGSETAYINGIPVKLDTPAFTLNSRTYTPFRFIAENLGAEITWIEKEQKVVVKRK